MRRPRPVIGVTGPDRGGFAAWAFTWLGVRMAGGKAIRIRPSKPRPIDDLDGLILGGGADVDPEIYGQSLFDGGQGDSKAEMKSRPFYVRLLTNILSPLIILLRKLGSLREPSINKERDRLETDLLGQALTRDMPVLGICRGSQILNVYLGGTLLQCIEDFYQEEPNRNTVYPQKQVRISPESHLAEILSCEWCPVNSLHSQAANDLGEGLRVVACDRSGVIQGLEHDHHTFVVGVQWHPEYLPQLPEQRRLFNRVVEEADVFRTRKKGGKEISHTHSPPKSSPFSMRAVGPSQPLRRKK